MAPGRPNATTTAATPPALDSGNQVSWQSIFWALVPIAFNSMTQPAGSLSDGMTVEESFFFRSSPLVCICDAFTALLQLICYSVQLRDVRLAVRLLSTKRLETHTLAISDTTERSSLSRLQDLGLVRAILFFGGALPQAIKLFSCKGIPWSQTCGIAYLLPSIILEILVVIPGQQAQLSDLETLQSRRVNTERIDFLSNSIRYLSTHPTGLGCFIYIALNMERGLGIDLASSTGLSQRLTAAYAAGVVVVVTLVAIGGRKGMSLQAETIFTVIHVFPVVAAICYLALWAQTHSETGSRIQLWLTTWLLNTTMGVAYVVLALHKRYWRLRGVCALIINIGMPLSNYITMYDASGTWKPGWAEYLG